MDAFGNLLKSAEYPQFTSYAKRQLCSENLTFLQAVHSLRAQRNALLRRTQRAAIFHTYIAPTAAINISEAARRDALNNQATTMFEVAYAEVFVMVMHGMLPDFRTEVRKKKSQQ